MESVTNSMSADHLQVVAWNYRDLMLSFTVTQIVICACKCLTAPKMHSKPYQSLLKCRPLKDDIYSPTRFLFTNFITPYTDLFYPGLGPLDKTTQSKFPCPVCNSLDWHIQLQAKLLENTNLLICHWEAGASLPFSWTSGVGAASLASCWDNQKNLHCIWSL